MYTQGGYNPGIYPPVCTPREAITRVYATLCTQGGYTLWYTLRYTQEGYTLWYTLRLG